MTHVKIVASGSALPKKLITNADLEKMVDTSDEWIAQRTGIKQRYILSEDESLLDLAHQAALAAIKQANIEPNDIGLLVVATNTPQQVLPSTSTLLQGRLGITDCISYDIQAACSGFVYGLATAFYLMKGRSDLRYALVIGAEALSKVTDWNDRTTCVLFGDGAGAAVLSMSNDPGILAADLGSDGCSAEYLEVTWGVGQGYEKMTPTNRYIQMNGREVYKKSIAHFSHSIQKVMSQVDISLDDVDWVIPHQANVRIIGAVADKLGISMDKFIVTVDQHGNTSSASIPLAFTHAVQEGKVKKGDTVLFVGFGAGFTRGSVLFVY
ncbi:MAG: ketoacyl-ACP synthase III [Gammaproteobacteria bacterium]|nr:ketoacyl-ACP synthase III [Gammaproteobacteria bacterium]